MFHASLFGYSDRLHAGPIDVVHLASRDVVSAQIEVLSYDGRTVTTVIYCTIEKGATTAVATRTGAH
jgi:hypothetical protein